LKQKIGRSLDVIVDEITPDGAVGRSKGDAPEIDGAVYLSDNTGLQPGDIVSRKVTDADDYDLWTD
jgi:ribosomal protein S12 methylthiotransferase